MTGFTLTPLAGHAKPFQEQVRDLTGSYITITPEQYEALKAGQHDFFEIGDGTVVTLGTVDGNYALMPLSSEAADQIRHGVYCSPNTHH